MQITALGHSCLLLDLDHPELGHTRILVDPWLSDHATGDAMGRFPRLRFEVDALGPIDAVFLSHAHSDHLDPYTLVRLWRELAEPPVLCIPVSLSFLLPIFREHLGDPEILVLHPHTPTPFRGVELLGFFDVGAEPTNEDDVMVLVVTTGNETVLVEADARLSLENLEFRAYVSELMSGAESAVYLTTENELTGTLLSHHCGSLEERDELVDEARNEMLEAVLELYEPTGDPEDLWQNERLLRVVHGQGLTAPHAFDPDWQRILFPVRVADRVAEERATAERHGCRHHIDSLTIGSTHTIVAGRITVVEPVAGLVLLDGEETRDFDATLPYFPDLPQAPLRSDVRDLGPQRARIAALLDNRFLPHLHGLRDPPVLHLLSGYGGYRIRVHFTGAVDTDTRDFVLGFTARGFIEEAADGEPQETYWANDLEDFLDGRCDEFSTFYREPFPGMEMRLWTCLATPLLHSDLVAKRVALHFERATDGLTPWSFVEVFSQTGR